MSDTIIISYPLEDTITINIDDNDSVVVNIIDEPPIVVYLCDDMGTTANNYDYLDNKPSINNVELVGNKTLNDLGIEPKRGADDFYVTNAEKTQGGLATGNAVLPTVKDVADKTQFAPNENGTILYHTTKWFTPTGTISTNGTTATSTSSQFTSAMVGAKLTIAGEERIIASYISATQVTVNSSYLQNYSGISSNNWGVFNKAFMVQDGSVRYVASYLYNNQNPSYYVDGNNNFISLSLYALYNRLQFNSGLKAGNSGSNPKIWLGDLSWITWISGNTDVETTTKNAGIRHITDAIEIFDGNTGGAYRDLNLRNLNYSGALNFTSDARLKDNLKEVENPLDTCVKIALSTRQYKYKDQYSYFKGTRTSPIAQYLIENGLGAFVSYRIPKDEIEGVIFGWEYEDEEFEEEVEGEVKKSIRRKVKKEGDKVMQVDNNFTPFAILGVAELKKDNDALHDEVSKLKDELSTTKKKIGLV